MRYSIEQLDDGKWVLHVNDEVVECTSKTDAILRMTARAVADDDAELAAAAAELAPGAEDAALAVANGAGEGSTESDGPMTREQALLPERWRTGTNGACMKAETGPTRDFTDCSFTWRPTPLPLFIQRENNFGHMESEWCGVVEEVAMRQDGGLDMSGRFFANEAGEAARLIVMGAGRAGCSVDPSEYVTASFVCTELDDEGWCVAGKDVFTAYEVAGLTVVGFPGFEGCWIEMDGADAMAASATEPGSGGIAPVAPPAAWFSMPEPEAGSPLLVRQPNARNGMERWAVPLTVTPEGQVYGHLAARGTCHIGYSGQCVEPPASPSGYAQYHLHSVVTAEGTRLAVGPLVVGLDHALHELRAARARDHYANTDLAWADVRASDGAFGIWVCGALRPDVTPEQLRVIQASSLSGDWRDIGGELDLIGAQLVNTPGFPITRDAIAASAWAPTDAHLAYRTEGGRMVALAAAGVVVRGEQQVDALVAAGTVAECTDCRRARRRPEATVATLAPADRDALAAVTAQLAIVTTMLDVLERRTRPLLTAAAQEQAARLDALITT